MKTYHLNELELWIEELRAGNEILLSGIIYTARDAAHKRLFSLIDNNDPLPFSFKNTAIYYAGPTPAKNNLPIGACGPTTSSRMDIYLPRLFDLGLRLTIGKGDRSNTVYQSIRRHKGAYLVAIGGAGALAARSVRDVKTIAFQELECESIKRITIENFPVFVGIDCLGNSIFK